MKDLRSQCAALEGKGEGVHQDVDEGVHQDMQVNSTTVASTTIALLTSGASAAAGPLIALASIAVSLRA